MSSLLKVPHKYIFFINIINSGYVGKFYFAHSNDQFWIRGIITPLFLFSHIRLVLLPPPPRNGYFRKQKVSTCLLSMNNHSD